MESASLATLPITVLVTVYIKVDPGEFLLSLQSLHDQTKPADEIIIVCDGPLTAELDAIVAEQEQRDDTTIIRLEKNQGLGPASQAGLKKARNIWVAKQDADDVSYPNRLETQWNIAQDTGAAIVGSAMTEFEGETTNVLGVRVLPTSEKDIKKYVRFNSPLNHPTVLLNRDIVLEVGGYRALHFLEDYDLWARVIAGGHKIVNVAEPLVYFRSGAQMLSRRVDKKIFAAEVQLQKNLVRYGLISPVRAIFNIALRNGARLLPKKALKVIYNKLFHRK